MIKNTEMNQFLQELSSNQPTPGGGGASALAGAYGAALGLMVVHLTLGKKKYAAVEETMKAAESRLEELREEFLSLADQDAESFAPLAQAYRLPSETEEEKAHKTKELERLLFQASKPPLCIMAKAVEGIKIMDFLARNGSRLAVSDVGVGVQFLRTALTGAVMNVWINTGSMTDREKAESLEERAGQLLEAGRKSADEIYALVENALGQ